MSLHWQFSERQGRWVWYCVDTNSRSIVEVSTGTYGSLYECVENARWRGFVEPPVSSEESSQYDDKGHGGLAAFAVP